MSPTVFRYKGYRFFFFSREETRVHIHVVSADGEAKIWLEPKIEVAKVVGYNNSQIKEIIEQVEIRYDEIRSYWERFFN